MRFKNRVVLVTGGASGIGKVAALNFAREGALVAVADLNEAETSEVVREMEGAGGVGIGLSLDVSDEESWVAALRKIKDNFKGLHVLVNSAGISGMVPQLDSLEYLDKLNNVHLRGTFLAIQQGGKLIKESGGGAIVTLSSVAAYVSTGNVHMGYCSAKAGILAMTRSAAGLLAPAGIRVNAIVPGLLPPMRTSILSKDPSVREEFFKRVPLGANGTREHAAQAIMFLASDDAGYTTGEEIRLTGGMLAYAQ